MYGFLTLQDAEKLYNDGFAIICDADSENAFIKNDELEYAEYLASKVDVITEIFSNIGKTFLNAFGKAFISVGQALTNVGKSLVCEESEDN